MAFQTTESRKYLLMHFDLVAAVGIPARCMLSPHRRMPKSTFLPSRWRRVKSLPRLLMRAFPFVARARINSRETRLSAFLSVIHLEK